LIVAGYATAVLLPIIGLMLGTALLVRRQMGHGLAVVAISLVAVVAGLLIWTTPLLISAWVTALIAVFVVPAVFLGRRAEAWEFPWERAGWAARIAVVLILIAMVAGPLLLHDESRSPSDRFSDRIERDAGRLQVCLAEHPSHPFRACLR
jgi:hypothetical protein